MLQWARYRSIWLVNPKPWGNNAIGPEPGAKEAAKLCGPRVSAMHWPDRVASEWKSAWTLPPRSSAAPSSRPQSVRPLARSDVPKNRFNQHEMNDDVLEPLVKKSSWNFSRPRNDFDMIKYVEFKTADYYKLVTIEPESSSFLPVYSQGEKNNEKVLRLNTRLLAPGSTSNSLHNRLFSLEDYQ